MKKSHLICVILTPLFIGSGLERSSARSFHAQPVSSRPAVEIKFREMRFGKPPLVELYFDVTLRNDGADPRWFLLPKSLSPETTSIAAKGGVDALEVFGPQGTGHVAIGRFYGTGGFQALLLPSGAEVRLRLLPISYWGDLPKSVQVEILIAKQLTIGGENAEVWFGENPASSVRADIAERADGSARMLHSRHTSDNKEVPTVFEEDRRLKLRVSINPKSK